MENMELEKLDLKSLQITEDIKTQLKAIIPHVFTENKIDFEKLKLSLGEEISDSEERFGLQWPGKKDCFKIIQEPSIETLKPSKEESMNWDSSENIFIEGDNLEVLKLLQKSYYGKVNIIYIDPPYNTGNDFVYKDNYGQNIKNYLEQIGDIDESGIKTSTNSATDGRYHSNWLNMMYPRLFLARNLLHKNGFIFISIDNNEYSNLKSLCDEIFGDDNYRNTILIKKGAKSVQSQFETWDKLGSGYEYILMYSKDSNFRFPKQLKELEDSKKGSWNNHWRGTDRPTMRYKLFDIEPDKGQWRWSLERSLKGIENYNNILNDMKSNGISINDENFDKYYLDKYGDSKIDLLRLSSNGKPEHFIPPSSFVLLNDVWFDFGISSSGEVTKLFGEKIFDNPKPTKILKNILKFGNKNDLILDFFGGSCSTAHAVLELNKEDGGNRKFIMVQIPEKCDEKSEAFKNGYKTLTSIGIDRIKKVLKANNTEDLGLKVFKLTNSNFKIWNGDINEKNDLFNQLQEFKTNLNDNSTDFDILYEIILKSGFKLSIEIKTLNIDGKIIFSIENDSMIICLEKVIDIELVKSIAQLNPIRVVFLDDSFNYNDQLKTNTVQIFKSFGIEDFKTI